ncbi:hypothetical protein ACFVZ4_13105 [Streptomyces goshikiensis]|uniref:hypothetical protein n=1 Tax=Streptomyces goshikiensis TaxID=1942 RepID=UPI0036824BB5
MAQHWWQWLNPQQWRQWGVVTTLTGLGSAVAYYLQVMDRPWVGIAGAACTFVAIVWPARQVIKERRSADAGKRVAELGERKRIADLLEPLANKLHRLVRISPGSEAEARQRLKETFVRELAHSFDAGVRVAFYEYHRAAKNTPVRLTCDEFHSGRDGRPRIRFVAGHDPGDYLLDRMAQRADEPVFVANVRMPGLSYEKPPAEWGSAGWSEYTTFGCASVSSGGKKWGMLTFDAVDPELLVHEDARYLQITAQLLAAGLHATGSKK